MNKPHTRHSGQIKPEHDGAAANMAPAHVTPNATLAVSWKGSIDSSWQQGGDWSTGGVPDANSIVTLGSGTTTIVYADATSSIYSLNGVTDALSIASGALTVLNTLRFTPLLGIDGGALVLDGAATIKTLGFTNAGTLSVAKGITATISGTTSFNTGTLTGPGILSLGGVTSLTDNSTSDSLDIGNGGTLSNTGIFNAAGRIGIGLYNGGNGDGTTGTIINSGTFNLTGDDGAVVLGSPAGGFVGSFMNTGLLATTGGSSTTVNYIGTVLNNTGSISVGAGTLELDGGGVLAGTESGPGLLSLANGSFATSGITVSGQIAVVNAGTLAVAAGKTGSIAASGTFTLAEGGNVVMGAKGNETVSGNAVFNSGTLSGTGTLTTAGVSAVADNSTTQSLYIGNGGTLANTGTLNAAGLIGLGLYNGGNGDVTTATIANSGTFNLTTDDAAVELAYPASGFVGSFNNAGLLAKTAGTGTSIINAVLNNTGTISVVTGTLELDGGGTLGGTEQGNGTLTLGNGSFATSGISVLGQLAVVNAGMLAVAAGKTGTVGGAGTLSLTSGGTVLVGAKGNETVSGNTLFNAGTLAGTGTLTTAGITAVADNSTTQSLYIGNGGTLANTGSFSDAGLIGLGLYNGGNGDTTSATIANSGTFDLTTDDGDIQLAYPSSGFVGSFNNTGLLAKTAGTGTSSVNAVLTTTGTLSALSGTLEFDGGGSIGGTITGTGTVALGGGNFTANGVTTTGTLAVINAGTLAIAAGGTGMVAGGGAFLLTSGGSVSSGTGGRLVLAGSTVFNSGTLGGPGTIATTGTTSIADNVTTPSVYVGNGGTWANAGLVKDAGLIGLGLYNGGNGDTTSATLSNTGIFDFTTDDGAINPAYPSSGFTAVFINAGTVGKTAGTLTQLNVALNSTGTINVATGALQLNVASTLSGMVVGAGTLALDTSAALGTLTGTGLLAVNTGTLTASGKAGSIATRLVFNNGTISDTGTVTTAGATAVAESGTSVELYVGNGATWINSGTISDAGSIGLGLYNGGNGDGTSAAIINTGVFNLTGDDAQIGAAFVASGFVASFANNGSLAKTGGTGTSHIGVALTSTGQIGAVAGTLDLDGGGTLGGSIAAGKTAVVLLGAGASFAASLLTVADDAANPAVTVAGTLNNASTLTLAGKLGLTGAAVFTNAKAGTALLTSADATITGSGTGYSASNAGIIRDSFAGTATLGVTLANTGTIDAAAGVLKLANVSGTGKLGIEAAATLDIGTGIAATQSIVFGGAAGATLKQDRPASVTTAMAGFGAGDRIDLVGLSATAATISGSTLTVTAAGKTYTYLGSSSLAALTPGIASDGNGGSLVSLYRAAGASITPTTLAFGNVHVGTTETLTLSVTNTAVTDGYSESLDASFSALPSALTSPAGITGLAAGASKTLAVQLAGTTAGSLAGTGTLALSSDGTGIDSGGAHALAGQTVAITGGVYRLATPQISTKTLNFGVVHVGDVIAQGITITNTGAADGFSENLNASATATGSATAKGSISELGAGAASTAIQIGVATTASGVVNGSVALGLISDGSTIDGLGTTALNGGTVTVSGTVDTLAVAMLEDPNGPAITAGAAANSYVLNLGTFALGGPGTSVTLGVLNTASGLSDLLAGSIAASGSGFTNTGFGTFSGLGAGQDEHAQSVTLSGATGGSFSETVTLTAHGTNTSGFAGVTQTETLTITGTVQAQGGTYTLAQGPNTITGVAGTDVFIAAAGALNSRDNLTGSTGYANLLQLTGAGLFDINAPMTFANIQTITAMEGQAASASSADTTQTLLLRDGTTETVNVASGTPASGNANPETIMIFGADNSDTINLGKGNDTVHIGGAKEVVNGGSGVDNFYTTTAAAGATIAGGGKGILHVAGGGSFTMGSNITALAAVVLNAASGNTQLVANGIAALAITGSGGADTITLGAASQTVNANGGAIHVLATAGVATAAITGAAGAVLEITNAANTTLNAADSNLIVRLDVAGKLNLGKASFINATGSNGADTLTAGATGQVLTGGMGADTLIGAASFGDTFLDTAAGLDGDSITNFGGSDIIDLTDLMYGALTESYSGTTAKGTLTLSDGTHHAAIALVGNFTNASFTFSADTNGGTSIGHI